MGRRQSKPSVQRYHDRVASRYDASYEDAYWQWHDALTWEYIKPHLPRDQAEPVLDLGCGTGKWGLKLLKSGYSVTFIDISGSMVEVARRKVEEAGLDKRAAFLRADLCDLSELEADTYGLAVAMGDPIGCTDKPPKAMKEIRRKLKPGGVLCATFDNRLGGLDFYLEKGKIEPLRDYLKTGKTHWLTPSADEQFPIWTCTPEQGRKLFEKSGFEVLDLVGKTILPMRHYRDMLEDPATARALSALERQLCRDTSAAGRAAHMQIAGRKPASKDGPSV